MKSITLLLRKEFQTGLRRKTEFLSYLVYAGALFFLSAFSSASLQEKLSLLVLYWLAQFFSVLFVNHKSMADAEGSNRAFAYAYYHPWEYFISKWIFYFILNALLALISAMLYSLWFGFDFFLSGRGLFFLFSGVFGLHAVTMMGVAFSASQVQATALRLILPLPLIFPVLAVLLKISLLFSNGTIGVFGSVYWTLLWSVQGIAFFASLLLFPYLWKP